ncbi:MAG: hypothetical protein GY749_28205 [Desulfobacteraceae bacterium]|nr:hypothetical protein [Desulfobacteraceae bacterium]
MYGLEAIAKANGWLIAITGASIVMTGLTVLSLIISQLPKVVAYMEKCKKEKELLKMRRDMEAKNAGRPPLDIEVLVSGYKPLVEELGESFDLDELHALCRNNNMPHAHLSIRSLREAGMLIPQGDGIFTWNTQ